MLVLRPGALGDALLALPALRALRLVCGPLTLASHGGAARLLASVGEVEHGLAFDDPTLGWLFSGQRQPRVEDIVAWMNVAGAGSLSGARLVAPSRPPGEQHCARYLLDTLAPLGVDVRTFDDRPLRVQAAKSDEVLVHPGSGSSRKNWPAARFAQTINCLSESVRLIVGEADEAAAREVEEHLGRPLPRMEGLSVDELAARLAGCRAYLGNDSGVSHLAGWCAVRTVVLFGPTSPTIWRPVGPDVHVLRFDVATDRVVSLLDMSRRS